MKKLFAPMVALLLSGCVARVDPYAAPVYVAPRPYYAPPVYVAPRPWYHRNYYAHPWYRGYH